MSSNARTKNGHQMLFAKRTQQSKKFKREPWRGFDFAMQVALLPFVQSYPSYPEGCP
jgi:hypothetical protein